MIPGIVAGYPVAAEVLPTVTWNSSDKSSVIALSGLSLVAEKTGGSSGQWDGVRATHGHSTGKRYFEVLHTQFAGTGQNHIIGVSNLSAAVTAGFAGSNTNGWGVYVHTGNSYHNSVPTSCLAAGWNGDVYQVAVDFAAGKIWFGRNGTFSGDPAAGTGEEFSGLSGTLYPHAALLNPNFYTSTARFRSASFTYSPPSGFGPWGG